MYYPPEWSKILNEYKYNMRFRNYVDAYCSKRGLTVSQAIPHEQVKEAFNHYKEE